MENVPAHLHGTAHHLGRTQAHWTLPTGKEEFPKCPITFTAALINILILAMDENTVCHVKGVARSDKPTGNYHLILQFPQLYGAF